MFRRFQKIALASIIAGLVILMSPSLVGSEASPTLLAISAGGDHTCAVLSNGPIRCWGGNQYGQCRTGS